MTGQNMSKAGPDEMEVWVCVCGKSNHGNFCVSCGKPREHNQANRQAIGNQGKMPAIAEFRQQNSEGSNQWKYALLGAGFIGLVAIGFFATKNVNYGSKTEQGKVAETTSAPTSAQSASESSQVLPAQEQEPSVNAKSKPVPPSSTQTASQPLSLSVSLGGICIGYKKNEVYSLLGKEQAITDPSKSGHLRYQYPNLEVVMTNSVVTGFVSKNAKVETERGIHEGSSLQDVLMAYGNDYSKFDYEDSTLYEYNMKSMNGKDCLQRFAIKNGRVDYISCRMLEGK